MIEMSHMEDGAVRVEDLLDWFGEGIVTCLSKGMYQTTIRYNIRHEVVLLISHAHWSAIKTACITGLHASYQPHLGSNAPFISPSAASSMSAMRTDHEHVSQLSLHIRLGARLRSQWSHKLCLILGVEASTSPCLNP